MRRPVSPRQMIDLEFNKMTRMLESFANGNPPASAADFRRMTDLLHATIADARETCVSFAAALPALDAAHLADRIDQSTPQMMTRFIEKHLEKEIPLLHIAGVAPEALTQAIMRRLQTIDEDVDLDIEIQTAAMDVVDQFPGIHAPDYHFDVIETLIREALGLEGTPPALEATVAAQKVQAMRAVGMVAAAPLTYAGPEEEPEAGF